MFKLSSMDIEKITTYSIEGYDVSFAVTERDYGMGFGVMICGDLPDGQEYRQAVYYDKYKHEVIERVRFTGNYQIVEEPEDEWDEDSLVNKITVPIMERTMIWEKKEYLDPEKEFGDNWHEILCELLFSKWIEKAYPTEQVTN